MEWYILLDLVHTHDCVENSAYCTVMASSRKDAMRQFREHPLVGESMEKHKGKFIVGRMADVFPTANEDDAAMQDIALVG